MACMAAVWHASVLSSQALGAVGSTRVAVRSEGRSDVRRGLLIISPNALAGAGAVPRIGFEVEGIPTWRLVCPAVDDTLPDSPAAAGASNRCPQRLAT